MYIAADGPREDFFEDITKVNKVREIVTAVNWNCEVKTLFHDNNLGCKNAVSSSINWFFEHEEQGIILEDDCLPHPDFFRFCDVLLDLYKNDDRVWVITGNNFQNGIKRGKGSYYFSRYNHVWGWATWRRAWKHYQGDISFWSNWKKSKDWKNKLPDRIERRNWQKIFNQVYKGNINSWAYPWTACVWYHGGLTATPNVNLVSNIGFGSDSTHTKNKESSFTFMSTESIGTIRHPSEVVLNYAADRYTFDHHFGGSMQRLPLSIILLPKRILGFIIRFIKQIIC